MSAANLVLISLLGGTALLLYGMRLVGDGLQRAAGTRLRHVLSTLSAREEQVLRMRFGIGEEKDHTLEEVGAALKVTRERIRQIEAKALRKLRHPKRCQKLKSFSER